VTGVDLQREDLLAARERLVLHDRLGEHGGGSWHLAAADIRRLPFPDAVFDGVVCSEVLEHVADHRSAAVELLRVLKPGRRLAASVPRYVPERVCWALSRAYRTAEGGHLRIYRAGDLVGLFTGLGARLDRRHHAHGLHTPYWWLKCLVGPDRTDQKLVNAYHRFLTWDIMAKPRLTRRLEAFLDPFLGKSAVFYFTKTPP
jgi:SAM-dependent methyltransferase